MSSKKDSKSKNFNSASVSMPGISDLIDSVLDKKQEKVKLNIAFGNKEVSREPKDIKKASTKIQLKMAAEETQKQLDYARYKYATDITKGMNSFNLQILLPL